MVWPGQGAAGKALPVQGFVVVVGRPKRDIHGECLWNRNSGQQNFRWGRRNLLLAVASTKM